LFDVPEYLKFVTFASDVLAVIMVWFCTALCSWDRKAVKEVLALSTQPPVKIIWWRCDDWPWFSRLPGSCNCFKFSPVCLLWSKNSD